MDDKLARCIVDRGRFEGSFRILRSDGAVRWLHNFAQVQVSPAGDPQRVVGTVQDITTARVGRLAMRRQNAILQQIVQGRRCRACWPTLLAWWKRSCPGPCVRFFCMIADGMFYGLVQLRRSRLNTTPRSMA